MILAAPAQGLANMLAMKVEDLRQYLAVLFAMLIEVTGGLGGMIMTGGHLPEFRKSDEPVAFEPEPPTEPIKRDNVTLDPEPAPHPVALWHAACVSKRKGTFTFATEAWQAFNQWAALHGHAPLNQTAFGTQMTELKVERRKRGGKATYQGLALLPAKPKLRVVR
jgi:hypothetical protein